MNKQSILLILGIFFIIACNVKRKTTNSISTPLNSAKTLISIVSANDKFPDWLLLKGKINLEKEGQKINFSTDIRIRRDSAIWISVNGPFGIELFRAVLTTDSLFYMNISKSTFRKQPISYLHQQIKTEISFQQIQKMFFGTPNIKKGKYSFLKNEKEYIISAKNKTKGTISFNIDTENFRIVEGSYFKSKDEYFKFNLTNYVLTKKNFLIPKKVLLDMRVKDNFLVELNHSKITTNKKLRMNFSIPKSYAEVQ